MPAPTTRSATTDATFFTALENGHPVRAACSAAGYARRCVYRWRRNDSDFAARWSCALVSDLPEEEADRRGCDGVDVPVFHKGEVRGTKRKYSDGLLFARLKAIRPEQYRERITMPCPQNQPLTVVLRDFSLEDVARRYAQGEEVDLATVPPRIRAISERTKDESGTRKAARSSTPDPTIWGHTTNSAVVSQARLGLGVRRRADRL